MIAFWGELRNPENQDILAIPLDSSRIIARGDGLEIGFRGWRESLKSRVIGVRST